MLQKILEARNTKIVENPAANFFLYLTPAIV